MKMMMTLALLFALVVPSCTTARTGVKLIQTAAEDARIYADVHGDFVSNSNLVEWYYLKGEGRYEVGIVWRDPITGQEVVNKVLKGEGKVEGGWHLVWDNETNRLKLEGVGYEVAHAVLGDPPVSVSP